MCTFLMIRALHVSVIYVWKLFCSSDPPEDLEGSQHSGYDVAHRVNLGHCGQRDLDRPGKTQDHIFYNGTVVVGLNTAETGLK